MYLRSVALLATVIVPVAASAATVSPIGGEVRVSTGQGFQKIVAPTEFAPGAQVIVSPEGSATIAYADDCVVTVKPAGVAVVQGRVPCRALPPPSHFGFEEAAAPTADSSFGFTPRVGEEKKTSAQESPAPEPPPPPPQAKKTSDDDDHDAGAFWLVGGVVVGGGALAAILLSQNHDDHPASP